MLCSDGEEVEWPYSSLLSTSLSSEQIKALLNDKCIASKLLAHSELSTAQFFSLYRDRGWRYGSKLRHLGNKLKAYKLDKLALGITTQRGLIEALKGKDRVVMLGKILELQE